MVIMSRGMSINPIIPSTMPTASKFGIIPIMDRMMDLNKTSNMIAMPNITTPSDNIWDLNRLCNMLLYKTSIPATVTLFSENPSLFMRSLLILSRRSFLLISSKESKILTKNRASLLSTETKGSTISASILSGIFLAITPSSMPSNSFPLLICSIVLIIEAIDKTLPISGKPAK